MKTRDPNRLRMLRAERRLAQWEVAKRLGMSQQLYSLIEQGRREAKDDERKKLARIFDTPADAIFVSEVA